MSRIVTMVIVALIGAIVAFVVFATRVDVASPGLAFAILAVAGLVYGLLGVIIGTLVPRELEGSLVLVFMADMDNALSSGLFPLDRALSVPAVGTIHITDALPLYHPHELFTAAVLDGDLATEHLLPVVGWLVGLLVVAFLAYNWATENRDAGLVSRGSP